MEHRSESLDGSRKGGINGMDAVVTKIGIVTGGSDRLIKVWRYDEGVITATLVRL